MFGTGKEDEARVMFVAFPIHMGAGIDNPMAIMHAYCKPAVSCGGLRYLFSL